MTSLYLNLLNDQIKIIADVGDNSFSASTPFRDVVYPVENFVGFSHEELRDIARTRGEVNGDELKV